MASISTSVLFLIELCVTYPAWSLMSYLMAVWKFKLTHAAAVTNIVDCLMNILPLGLKILLTTTSLGIFWVLVLTLVAFTTGTGLLWMSTPAVLSRATGTCSQYQPECIGITQRILFYISLVAIIVGGAGFSVAYPLYRWKKIYDHTYKVHIYECARVVEQLFSALCGLIILLIGGGGILAAMWCNPWTLKFGIPAIMTSALGLPFLIYLYCNKNSVNVDFVLPSLKLSRKQARAYLFKVLISTTFLICGIVSSVSDTFFLEQANLMNRKLGRLLVPDQILQIFYKLSQFASPMIYERYGSSLLPRRLNSPYSSIIISMILAGICCIVAALTEKRRLDLVMQYGSIDKPEQAFPLTMFVMIPQLLILGSLDGLFESKLFTILEKGSHAAVKYDSPAHLRVANKLKRIREMAASREEFVEKRTSVQVDMYSREGTLGLANESAKEMGAYREQLIEEGSHDQLVDCLSGDLSLANEVIQLKADYREGSAEVESHELVNTCKPVHKKNLANELIQKGDRYREWVVKEGYHDLEIPRPAPKNDLGQLSNELIQEMAEYREDFARTIRGLGIIGGTVTVYVIGKVTKRGTQPSWFQDTLNKSRLDKYYWFLAALCAINLALYLLLVLCMKFMKPKREKDEGSEAKNDNEIDRSQEIQGNCAA